MTALNLREEKAAVIKELEALKEESATAETRYNSKLLEVQNEHKCALQLRQVELNAARSAAHEKTELIAAKNAAFRSS